MVGAIRVGALAAQIEAGDADDVDALHDALAAALEDVIDVVADDTSDTALT